MAVLVTQSHIHQYQHEADVIAHHHILQVHDAINIDIAQTKGAIEVIDHLDAVLAELVEIGQQVLVITHQVILVEAVRDSKVERQRVFDTT